ncbi:N-acetylglucosamine-6-phosphate deacetylase [Staphylococcus pseudoxylosus]|uniref:N-acetylglucosamine-6-phosphate deacetylase n=1 Tax=Staphylococcus pseudoxylosus TaxID=2282419 RepID=A0AAQ0MHH7_9STAP|nr:N-acetylglucosamine-6-phosphate deacetylase [Staphylococcus pseudoxylosus]PTI83750.1 N-acetylglucosamine-6-phosphate deacetylase [Staphylococcus xylosus]MBM2657991.1 N-acetylglucosamine-6-phosphate deacetylase [Staphylococcus pseudoxylosus]MCE5001455.1 N-acetylglucosamine-6-phosphate deacetylase [Staphylococcus pseudoxylosus]MDW8546067.1 N-acetylglucosamine-6-phosphate deacetylase [Staphylococcus pseudoxylosus]MEB5782852.1 N-acetylglucosamine-6-phosphate deacetylase [Staphylococcus pseudoxy
MSKYVIANGRIYTENETIEHGYILVEDGKITQITEGEYQGDLTTIDVKGQHVLPGFIDIHMHGGYGEDAMDASFEGLKHLSESLLSEGTTSFLATTMTQSDDNIIKALKNIVYYQAQQDALNAASIVGIHLEGPFISEYKVGAQNPAYVQRPSVEKVQQFQEIANNQIKVMTFAPEVEGADETLSILHDQINFSIGHTVATFDEVNEAVAHGAKHVTHLYNAGTAFEHRNPGLSGAAWVNDELSTESIVDGIHSHPASVKIAYKQKGNKRFFLITDAMRAKGMPDGEYDLGGQNVVVKGSEARLTSGALAGSILKMNEGLKNLIEFTGAPLDDLWRVTSLNQAIALKIEGDKGSIAIGKDADIVVVDDDIQVLTTIKSGKVHNFNS